MLWLVAIGKSADNQLHAQLILQWYTYDNAIDQCTCISLPI